MTPAQIDIQLTAAITAAACALPGVFLVLRRMAMMSDAISHTVLLGIVLAFFATKNLHSPWLVIGAALTGIATVVLVELLRKTQLVREDASIGLVFPFLFALAVVILSTWGRNVHLHTSSVLEGELVFAPFDRTHLLDPLLPHANGIPTSLFVMGIILLVNLAFILVFYKELKLATFDPTLAAALGLTPVLIHYGLMMLVSITAVGAFDAVGSILVIALMIGPPIGAYLLTDRLAWMLALSVVIGVVSAIGGYWLARWTDSTISGAMAVMVGVSFALLWMVAPNHGLVALLIRRHRQRWDFAQTMLAAHLFHHENTPVAGHECTIDHLHEHMLWEPAFAQQVVRRALHHRLVRREGNRLLLTEQGRQVALQSLPAASA